MGEAEVGIAALGVAMDPRIAIPASVILFVLDVTLCIAISVYWIRLEEAKKAAPNTSGYGHWYFAPFWRILFTIGMSIVLIVFTILTIFFATSAAMYGSTKSEENHEERFGEKLLQAVAQSNVSS